MRTMQTQDWRARRQDAEQQDTATSAQGAQGTQVHSNQTRSVKAEADAQQKRADQQAEHIQHDAGLPAVQAGSDGGSNELTSGELGSDGRCD